MPRMAHHKRQSARVIAHGVHPLNLNHNTLRGPGGRSLRRQQDSSPLPTSTPSKAARTTGTARAALPPAVVGPGEGRHTDRCANAVGMNLR